MKKLLLIAALVIGVSLSANAQSRALGIRFGYGIEGSYQHICQKNDFFEVNLGLVDLAKAFNVTVLYNFAIARPKWTSAGEWCFYAGPGLSLGYVFKNYPTMAIAGQVGLDYTFWFPLQISVDIRPIIGINPYSGGARFYLPGVTHCCIPTLAVRYRF